MTDYYGNTSEFAPQSQMPQSQMPQPTIQQPMAQNMMYNLPPYNWNPLSVDYKDAAKRSLKYILEGLAVAFVAYWLGKLDIKEVLVLGLTAAAVFAILDTYSPTVAWGARVGTGVGLGQSMMHMGMPVI